MINITSDKTLKVLLPNMNKALAEAIKSASAEQLTQLGEQKDIKSILASLFDDKLTTQKSDKIILDILKNAPVFKEMGNFSKDIKLLKQELKSRSIPKEIEISLTEFIKNVDSIEPKLLKSQITNSGIFLESKLANPTTFKEIFKEIIQEIKTLLQKSSNKDARQIEQLLEPLIQDENIPSNPKEVTPLLKNITKIIDSISALNEKAKSPQTKELEPIIDDLKKIIKPDVTLNKPLDIKTLIPKIETLYVKVEQSSLPQKMKLLDSIEKIITTLRSIPLPEVTPEKVQLPQIHKDILLKVTDEIKKVVDLLPAKEQLIQNPKTKELEPIIDDLKKIIKHDATQNKPLDIKTLIPKIETLYVKVEQSNLPQKMKLLDSIEKIITTLRSIPLPEVTPEKVQLPQIHKDILLKVTDEIKKVVDLLPAKEQLIQNPKTKELEPIIDDLKKIIKHDATQNKPLDIKTLIPKIETLYVKVEQSSLPQKMKLLDSIEKIITSLRSIPLPEVLQEKVQLPQIHKDILLKLTDEIKKITHFLESSTIKLDDPVVSKEMNTLNEKLKSFTKPDIPNKILNENIANDAKANLLRLSEEIKQNPQLQNTDIEKLVDKLTLQIDYFQLYSHLNNSSSIYFPFVWDQLEDGGFSIKKGKKDKFYCEINLNLKDYGELKLMLTLYNKNQINLHAYSQSDVLKSGMKEDLELLHSTFKEANLILREIRFFDIKNDKTGGYNEPLRALDVGFEVKI